MSRVWTTLLVVALACVIGSSAAFAQEGKKKERKKGEKPSPEQVFKKLDKDGDGKLTLDEAKGKGKRDPEKVEKMFKARDKDSDGVVTLEEFTAPRKHHKKGEKKESPKKEGEKKEA